MTKHTKDCDSRPNGKSNNNLPCSCYAGRTKKQWIAWAEKEIKEYQKFIKFLSE